MHDRSLPVGDREAEASVPRRLELDERAVLILSDGRYFREFRRDHVIVVEKIGRAALFSLRAEARERTLTMLKRRGIEASVVRARITIGKAGE